MTAVSKIRKKLDFCPITEKQARKINEIWEERGFKANAAAYLAIPGSKRNDPVWGIVSGLVMRVPG